MPRLSLQDDILSAVEKKFPPLKCIKLNVSAEECGLFDSKVGGMPYYPKNMEYPVGRNSCEGRVLRLLAQINMAEMPHIDGFPEKGMLQFFVANDDMIGFDGGGNTGGFKVVYHEDIITDTSLLYSEEDIPTDLESDEDDDEFFPVDGEYRLRGELAVSNITMDDFRMSDFVIDIICEKTGIKMDDIFDIYSILRSGRYKDEIAEAFGDKKEAEAFFDALWDYGREKSAGEENTDKATDLLMELANSGVSPQEAIERMMQFGAEMESPDCNGGSRMGGYPAFAQNDPRPDDWEQHTVLLFQLDSSYTDEIVIEWGDGGVANFFITPEQLKALDFSDVVYNWDCG